MQSANKIMKKKQFIKDELDRRIPRKQSDVIWRQAMAKLDQILQRYADIQPGERLHTDNYIFPSAALYMTISEAISRDTAYDIVEWAAIRNSSATGKKLAKVMCIPFMPGLFVKIWDPMTKKMFGPAQGFRNVFYPKKKGEFRMDITACPYFKYYTELGCPELTKISCMNDDRCYGNLPGLEFRRSGTLGTGAERCDFCIRRR